MHGIIRKINTLLPTISWGNMNLFYEHDMLMPITDGSAMSWERTSTCQNCLIYEDQ